MRLELSDMASIAEIVSGLAVVITLVFLILSVRENTDITRAEMYSSHLESFNEMFRDIYRDPELMRIHDAWLSGDLSALDDQDIRILSYLITNGFRTYEMAYFSQTYGLYGPDEWSRMELLSCLNYRRGAGTEIEEFVSAAMSRAFMNYLRANC